LRLLAIGPGAIKTAINQSVWSDPAAAADLLTKIPMGHMGSTDDIANMAVVLCSDVAGYVTGTTVMVDGAMTPYPEFARGGQVAGSAPGVPCGTPETGQHRAAARRRQRAFASRRGLASPRPRLGACQRDSGDRGRGNAWHRNPEGCLDQMMRRQSPAFCKSSGQPPGVAVPGVASNRDHRVQLSAATRRDPRRCQAPSSARMSRPRAHLPIPQRALHLTLRQRPRGWAADGPSREIASGAAGDAARRKPVCDALGRS
jgi:hypothetical protein